ncbi:MAG: hypothetical protein U5K69_07960 [Balneolaceae bacterium]|nr:hypothetical protein [Balneolaceae bacterium]
MHTPDRNIKIKIDTPNLSAEDIEDLFRWENEGGHPADKPDLLSSITLPLPLKKDWIFEVKDTDIIIEDGQLYLQAGINLLSLH